jgi:hypothetical protein
MRYEVDDENAVRIFQDGEDVPFWFQPHYPNGDAFDTKAEAEAWAVLAIASQADDQPFAPNGKGQTGLPKPTAEELRVAALARMGLSVEDLKALLGL